MTISLPAMPLMTSDRLPRRRHLNTALVDVLSPEHLKRIRALVREEKPEYRGAEAPAVLHWLRLNMPTAAGQVQALIHPSPLTD
ncbi:MAG: hypothetical protein AAB320_03975 [Elusimicrobiota bacterium]